MTRSPRRESTITVFVANYELIAVMILNGRLEASYRRSQPATENGVRDCRSNWLVVTPTLYKAVLPDNHLNGEMCVTNLNVLAGNRTWDHQHTRQAKYVPDMLH